MAHPNLETHCACPLYVLTYGRRVPLMRSIAVCPCRTALCQVPAVITQVLPGCASMWKLLRAGAARRWTPPKSSGRRTVRSGSTQCTGIEGAGGARPHTGRCSVLSLRCVERIVQRGTLNLLYPVVFSPSWSERNVRERRSRCARCINRSVGSTLGMLWM